MFTFGSVKVWAWDPQRLYRSTAATGEGWIANALTASRFPQGVFDVFVHGEASEVQEARRHLAENRNVDLSQASISPYWRRRHTDEEWRSVKRQWMTEQARQPSGAASSN